MRYVATLATIGDLISLLMQSSRTYTDRPVAVRPVATRDHRRFPLGWTAPEVSVLTRMSKRTLQVWRKDGFFVPALPPEATGHVEPELYGAR
jgi:hypothetical protein